MHFIKLMMYVTNVYTAVATESIQNTSEEITTTSDESGVKNVMARFDRTLQRRDMLL